MMDSTVALKFTHRNTMCRGFAALAVITVVLFSSAGGYVRADPPQQALAFFERQVRPALVDHCVKCHGPEKQNAGLRLDSRSAMLQGGDSGPAIVPGQPQASLLVTAIQYNDADYEMPPDEKLHDGQIAALTRWIRIGAPWPKEQKRPAEPALGDQDHLSKIASQHWAFRPVVKPTVPVVADGVGAQTAVDAFVIQELERQRMRLSPPADRRTLLRRISFDLTGLPPTPQEIAAFVSDKSPGAYQRVVDRLLASPHYGERWGRHWLDIARYADTSDFVNLVDPRYPYAYTYRDYVISALNADTPYDQFLQEQLAADQYTDQADSPSLAALGFLTVGPRFRGVAPELISDRVDVVTRGLLGLTVTCARCHDHKYDPIPTEDYYALYGVFASCVEPDEYPVIATKSLSKELIADFERARGEKVAALEKYGEGLRRDATQQLRGGYARHLDAYYQTNVARTASVRKLITGGKFKETALTPLARNLDRIGTERRWKADPVLRPWAMTVRLPAARFAAALQQALKPIPSTGAAQDVAVNATVLAALTGDMPQNKRQLLQRYGELFDRIQQQGNPSETGDAAGRPKAAANDVSPIRRLLDDEGGPFYLSRNAVVQASRLLGAGRQKLAKLENAIKQVEADHPGAPARAMVLLDRDKPVTATVFLRGDPQRRGDRVDRRFLSVLAGENPQPFQQGSGRRELAEAITDPANPLTARVLVNRVWRHHFGQALVDSTDDFGLQTPQPTHAELLDYLAARFVEQGWSLKKLHRMIVLSRVYQQSSQNVPAYAAKDPENKLLWRASRRRLDFESLRDAILTVCGTLDRSMGGRAVSLTETPFTTRRTVYGFVNRMNLDALFATFDFPSPDQSASQRAETMVPQQALFVMNDPFMVQQAKRLAALPQIRKLTTIDQKMGYLYRRLYGRGASPAELKIARAFLAEAAAVKQESPSGPWQYGFGSADVDGGFTALKFWTGQAYQVGKEFPDKQLGHVRITRVGGHPGRDLDHAVMLRWIAPRAGVIEISGTLAHLRDRGDGVRGRIVVGEGRVLGAWDVFNENTDTRVAKTRVTAGETVDFVVDCGKHPTSDAYTWSPVIRVLEPAAGGQAARPLQWSAREDFGPPPPPTLSPWQQICQALLLSNEFLFLD